MVLRASTRRIAPAGAGSRSCRSLSLRHGRPLAPALLASWEEFCHRADPRSATSSLLDSPLGCLVVSQTALS